MQPRREREDEESEEIRFQVTKRGDSDIVDERCEVRRGWRPTGTKEAAGGVLATVEGTRLLEEEEAGEEEVRDTEMRSSAGIRGCDCEVDVPWSGPELIEGESESASSLDSVTSSSSSRPLG
jgi:hypothetical protein